VRRTLLALSVAVLALFALRTNLRIPDWDSTDKILLAQMRDRPDSFRAHWHAARVERRVNRVQAAFTHYTQAVQLWPYRERLILEAAAYGASQGQLQMAFRLTSFGAQRWPRNLNLQRLLATNALDLGDTVTARRAMLAGLKLAPNDDLLRKMSVALAPKKSAR
jgi:predicted Zn-dependent protease